MTQIISLPEGEFRGNLFDGEICGQGKIYTKDRELVYEGGFENNHMDGLGISYNLEKNQNQDDEKFNLEFGWEKFEGIFKKSEKNGIGSLYFGNGDEFVGEFENDKANGLGVYICQDGGKVIGEWKDNKIERKF